eukprot:SAG25_NODE_1700_length_2519_cov_5.130165_2_plen_114_part_00
MVRRLDRLRGAMRLRRAGFTLATPSELIFRLSCRLTSNALLLRARRFPFLDFFALAICYSVRFNLFDFQHFIKVLADLVALKVTEHEAVWIRRRMLKHLNKFVRTQVTAVLFG